MKKSELIAILSSSKLTYEMHCQIRTTVKSLPWKLVRNLDKILQEDNSIDKYEKCFRILISEEN
jgi:hypothetical protein